MDVILCVVGFLVRGEGRRTSSRARIASIESSDLTRLRRFEIVEKSFRLALKSLRYGDFGMIATAISVFRKISLANLSKSLKSLYRLHKIDTLEAFSGVKRFRRFRIVDKRFQNHCETSTIRSRSPKR